MKSPEHPNLIKPEYAWDKKDFFFLEINFLGNIVTFIVQKDIGFDHLPKVFYGSKLVPTLNQQSFKVFCFDHLYQNYVCQEPKSKVFFEQQHALARWSKNQQFYFQGVSEKSYRYIDLDIGFGLFYIDSKNDVPTWEHASPFKFFLHTLAIKQEALLLHAGAIKDANEAGSLLVGPGGSGKSSLTTYAFLAHQKIAGDDYLLVKKTDKVIFAHPIYRTIKIHPSSPVYKMAQQSDDINFHTNDSDSEKDIFLINQSNNNLDSFPVQNIFSIFLDKNIAELKVKAFEHFIFSSMQQQPIWIDKTLLLAKQIYENLDHRFLGLSKGLVGLEESLKTIDSLLCSKSQ